MFSLGPKLPRMAKVSPNYDILFVYGHVGHQELGVASNKHPSTTLHASPCMSHPVLSGPNRCHGKITT